MSRIINIKTYNYSSHTITFAGKLRNQDRYELFQNVFILHEGFMYQCKIVGIELPPSDNPDFIYTIELPKELIALGDDSIRVSRHCDKIFKTIDEAKYSAINHLNHLHKLNLDNIDRYFSQYEKVDPSI